MGSREYIPGESATKRLLRQEVAFGCPICRDPFLVYHHFDPTWAERHHWDPAGVIALCRKHHDQASRHFTKEYLRELKAASYSVEDIKERFPWIRKQAIVRVGGLYSGGSQTVIRLDGEPVIELNADDNGLLSVSFMLRSKDGQIIAMMVDNVFEPGPRLPFDLITTTTADSITILSEPRDIAVAVHLSRIKLAELDAKLNLDLNRVQAKMAGVFSRIEGEIEERLLHLPSDIARELRDDLSQARKLQSTETITRRTAEFRERFGTTDLPDDLLQAHFSGDPVGHKVRSWATANCVDSDGLISFLDFRNLSLHGRDKHVRIRNGVGDFDYNAAFDCDTAFSL